MKRVVLLVLMWALAATLAVAQATGNCGQQNTRFCADSQTISTSGTTITVTNNGGLVPTFEELITGTPATVSIVVQGCGKGATCDTLDTYTTVANAVRAPSVSKLYSYYTVTASWTGGTSPTVTVNTSITSARLSPSLAPSGSVTSFSAANLSPLFTTSVASPTTTPALSFALSSAAHNAVFAGPTSGTGAPTYRVLVAGDIPTSIPIANVGTAGLSGTSPITISAAGAIACPTCNISSANVNSITGDGTIVSNSASTGAVTLTLANTPTGTGGVVLATSPSLVTPALGTPSALVITNATGACTACMANAATTAVNLSGGGTTTGTPAASTAGILNNTALFTGGSGTTTFPLLMIQPSTATAETGWSTAGTFIGVNSASGFTGNFFDFHLNNGVSSGSLSAGGNLAVAGNVQAQKFISSTNCASGASPAVCSASSAGAVAMPTGTNPTLVVNTTAVTANSEILLTVDDSLTIGGTTCNSTLATLVGGIAITARTAATSFTVSYNGTIAVNPLCFSYAIVN